jgi:hypothetical protein
VVAPALKTLTGAVLTASKLSDLPAQLEAGEVPAEIVRLAAQPVGFVNFYTAFRNAARPWIALHLRDLSRIVAVVASASSDPELREAYRLLDTLPRIRHRRRRGGAMPPVALVSPLLACLDPRSRSPIINSRATVQERLRRLGLHRATVVEQFDGFLNLIGQVGIRDAFELDTTDVNVVAAALKGKPRRAPTRPRARRAHARLGRTLGDRDDEDVEFFRQANTVRMRMIHHKMTNALRSFCSRRNLRVEEGISRDCRFDALIRNYRQERHLLIEVKPDSKQPSCRLAVGQLLDYRRQVPDRARVDLAVLFPQKPNVVATAFLNDVGVDVLWFTHDMKTLNGFRTQ